MSGSKEAEGDILRVDHDKSGHAGIRLSLNNLTISSQLKSSHALSAIGTGTLVLNEPVKDRLAELELERKKDEPNEDQ